MTPSILQGNMRARIVIGPLIPMDLSDGLRIAQRTADSDECGCRSEAVVVWISADYTVPVDCTDLHDEQHMANASVQTRRLLDFGRAASRANLRRLVSRR